MANGYVGVSPWLALMAFTMGKIIDTIPNTIKPSKPNPKSKISGMQMIK